MSLSHQYVQDHILSIQRLNPTEQAALEEHLTACPECITYAALHQTLRQTLPHSAGSPRLSERDIREKIQIVRTRVEKRRWPAQIVRHTLSFAGAAAGLVLLFLILIVATRTMPGRLASAPEVTRMVAGSPNIAPTAVGVSTPLPSAQPVMPFLASLPMDQGTTWVYSSTHYAQAGSDPEKILKKTTTIEEHIADVHSVSPYTILHIQGSRTILSTDPGWNETGMAEDNGGSYEFWYVIQNNQVFRSNETPDLAKMNPAKEMFLAFQFPMFAGSEWCYNPVRRGTVENPTPAPNDPCESRRVIMKAAPYQASIGDLSSCYEIHDVFSSGDLVTQFCDGIGIVSEKYGHMGAQFGTDQELIQYTNGKDGSTRIAPAPTATLTGAPLNARNRVVAAVAVQGQTVYVGIGSHLAAIDISRPGTPQLAAQSTELPGGVMKVISLPGGAGQRVAASAGRYLALLDTSSPDELTLITQSKLPGPITALIVDLGTYDLYAGGKLAGDTSKGFVARLNATAPDTLQLIEASQLPAPVQSLALTNGVLYAALTGDPPKVVAIPIRGNAFGEPTDLITGTVVASMTTTGGMLYIGTDGQMLAYDLTLPLQPQFAWQIAKVNNAPIPGTISGFEVHPNTIFTAGRDAAGIPFHLVLAPPVSLKTGSMVDTASCMAVSAGQMVFAGDRLEIYDSRDPQNLKLIGFFPLVAP